ncbi:MAG TPA: PatB family C-S lyase [Williamwhitmania sp.]|nr:PatB family C-S lyase [Williamwhitmania sp.]
MLQEFDELIPRENTACVKYDLREKTFGNSAVTPLWVADMDFATPIFIREAIAERLTHPIFGYTFLSEEAKNAVVGWVKRQHGWDIKPEWITLCPGIVPAINVAILAFTNQGQKVAIQPPVYTPFFAAINDHRRTLVENPLIANSDGYYQMNFDHLESLFASGVKMLILSNPHNPVGRVFTKAELTTLAEMAMQHGATIISDEIHSDITMPPHRHTPLAAVNEGIAQQSITFIAPSKTFNLAGLSTGLAIIPNSDLRKKFGATLSALHIGMGNIFGITAMQSAYTHGDEWVKSLNSYLYGNLALVKQMLHDSQLPISANIPEGTYLSWVDFRGLKIAQEKLIQLLIQEANVGLSDGTIYGTQGAGFMRLNAACPRATLSDSLSRIVSAIKTRL